MRCAVQVLHVAGGVQERVQVGQRTGQAQHPAAAAADGDPAAAAGRQVAAGRGRQGDGQVAAAMIDVAEVDRRQVDVAADIFRDRDVAGQATGVGRIIVDRGDVNRLAVAALFAAAVAGESRIGAGVALVVDRDRDRGRGARRVAAVEVA